MKAADVMTRRVVSTRPDASIAEMAKLMLDNGISGLPVLDEHGDLVGIVTESDCLRRAETGTERKRPRWLEFLIGPGRLAKEYIHTHGRRVAEVMTQSPITITEETPLEEAVHLMESRRIKRLPVVRGAKVVGIVSRANLLHALASVASNIQSSSPTDTAIRDQLMTELAKQPWAPPLNATVRDGVVDLWGVVLAPHQYEATIVAAENIPGVKSVRSHVAWVDPVSGMIIYDASGNGSGTVA
ncbi:MAG: CBS domain-containing protein [Isosphaeraceae bacterium]